MTEITILIQSSSGRMVIAIAAGDDIIFDSDQYDHFHAVRDPAIILEYALKQTGISPGDFRNIFVDAGPGRLGATRTGVVFANSLAYGLGIPAGGVNSLELLGFDKSDAGDAPVVCIRRASRPYYFLGYYIDNKLSGLSFTSDDILRSELMSLSFSFVLAGNVIPEEICTSFALCISYAGNMASSASFLRLVRRRADPVAGVPVIAITEDSCIFRRD